MIVKFNRFCFSNYLASFPWTYDLHCSDPIKVVNGDCLQNNMTFNSVNCKMEIITIIINNNKLERLVYHGSYW